MSFFIKKMSQNVWATIMPFGPVILIFYWHYFVLYFCAFYVTFANCMCFIYSVFM